MTGIWWCSRCQNLHRDGDLCGNVVASQQRDFDRRNAEFKARARINRRAQITVVQLLERWKAENVSGWALSIRNAAIELVEAELTAMVDDK